MQNNFNSNTEENTTINFIDEVNSDFSNILKSFCQINYRNCYKKGLFVEIPCRKRIENYLIIFNQKISDVDEKECVQIKITNNNINNGINTGEKLIIINKKRKILNYQDETFVCSLVQILEEDNINTFLKIEKEFEYENFDKNIIVINFDEENKPFFSFATITQKTDKKNFHFVLSQTINYSYTFGVILSLKSLTLVGLQNCGKESHIEEHVNNFVGFTMNEIVN